MLKNVNDYSLQKGGRMKEESLDFAHPNNVYDYYLPNNRWRLHFKKIKDNRLLLVMI